jgi:1,4-dihydroxy-2-naphthoyl-CoA synthase
MKMAVVPVKSLEHEKVKWCNEIPEDIDPRLKGLL